jgi:uncharacterized protein YjiS (DUF1127 family)
MDTLLLHKHITRLDPRDTLCIRSARGLHLGVIDGDVWVTQAGDLSDHVLGGGASFRFNRNGLAVISALRRPASVVLEDGILAQSTSGNHFPSLAHDEKITQRCRTALALRHSIAYQQQIRSLRSAVMAGWLNGALQGLRRIIRRAVVAMSKAREMRKTREALHGLHDLVLKDIGIRRDQIDTLVTKPGAP